MRAYANAVEWLRRKRPGAPCFVTVCGGRAPDSATLCELYGRPPVWVHCEDLAARSAHRYRLRAD